MIIYPYKAGSASAKALAEALGVKRARREGKALKHRGVLINWGSSSIERDFAVERVINDPHAVSRASNKLSTLNALRNVGVAIPPFTQSLDEANKWLAEGATIVERHVLSGHSGKGIRIVEPGDGQDISKAPLYTKYIAKKQEYRIHVFRDNAFFLQRKARKKEVADEEVNWKVRNHDNGFIFANQDVELPEAALGEAVNGVEALGLDFGAVDLIWNQREDKYYVLEINTAPGLTGTTLEKYAEQFRRLG